jgi:DNA anti-recombination protein RmuC
MMTGITLLVIAVSGLVTTILVNKRIDKLQNHVEDLIVDNKRLRQQLGEDYTESTKNFHTLNNKINQVTANNMSKINELKTYADKTFIKKADNNQVTYNG